MLARNDIVTFNGETRFRLLATFPATDDAWLIELDDAKSQPTRRCWSALLRLAKAGQLTRVTASGVMSPAEPSEAARACAAKAWARIQLLVETPDPNHPGLFLPRAEIFQAAERSRLLKEAAMGGNGSVSTLYRYLRRYWVGGQTTDALLGRFSAKSHLRVATMVAAYVVARVCGKGTLPVRHSVTKRRGNPRTLIGYPIFEMTDEEAFKIVEWYRRYLKKHPSISIPQAHQAYLKDHHTYLDGNSVACLKPEGECPSEKQFRHVVTECLPLETRKRLRHGDKAFDRDHRAKLGSVQADCLGIGHIYEIDGSVGDVWLVSAVDRTTIIGKPTIVVIFDRRTNLIVGFYVGLEGDSWVASKEAIVSIFEDKEALCRRLGVPYRPEDWPADGIACLELLADRGPMIATSSNLVVGGLTIAVTNLPSERPDWKPTVECGIKQIQRPFKSMSGHEPPVNPVKRRGKRYKLDATLTLFEFIRHFLLAVIAHNRRPGNVERLTLEQVGRGLLPIPTHMWRDEEAARMGLLRRIGAEAARTSLLDKGTARTSRDGILFKGCYYTCSSGMKNGWFLEGARPRDLDVSWDRRLCRTILVHLPNTTRTEVATLTTTSMQYAEMSFEEVAVYRSLKATIKARGVSVKRQEDYNYATATEPIADHARSVTQAAIKGKSAASRTKHSKEARAAEKVAERVATADVSGPRVTEAPLAPVVDLATRKARKAKLPRRPSPSAAESLAQQLREYGENLLNEQL